MIDLRNLEKAFDSRAGQTFVLRRIRLTIAEGEFVTIMGPSGAGKSTLLSILGMLDHAWTGEYHFLGEAVHEKKPKDRVELNKKNIGFVFQQYHLLDDLTVAENLDIPLSYRNVKGSERAAIVADTLDRFRIVAKKDLFPSQLSGGQQQLVGVARALIAGPKLLLADEPTGNLHSDQGREIMRLFKKLNDEGMTIIQVTHSEENASYGNRIVRLRDGWIEGAADAVADRVDADRDTLALEMTRGLRVAAAGFALGMLATAASTRLISGMLLGVNALDPLTLRAVLLLLAAFTLASSDLPARRAARLSPMHGLRSE